MAPTLKIFGFFSRFLYSGVGRYDDDDNDNNKLINLAIKIF